MFRPGEAAGGRYTVIREIGRGGSGIVYLVLQNSSAKLWAMKALYPPDGEKSVRAGGRGQEMQLLKSLRFPGLPELADVFEDRGRLCLVMTMVEGRTLLQVLKTHEKAEGTAYDIADIRAWGLQLCGILGYLHERPSPVIYMDLKPSNVMLAPDGTLYLVDLGASVMLQLNCIEARRAATPSYAAPEVMRGEAIGPWTDIYGIGRLLEDLAGGLQPEVRKKGAKQLAALSGVTGRCLAKDPSRRYPSCTALAKALAGDGQSRRYIGFKAGLALAVCGLCAGGGLVKRTEDKDTVRQAYAALIEDASGLPGASVKQQLTQAAALMPEKAEAYCLMVEQLSADGVLDDGDLEDIRALIYAREGGNSQDNLTLLKQDPESYAEFAYHLGTALYECADTPENARLSAHWLEQMLSSSCGLDAPPWPVRKKYAQQILEMNACRGTLDRQIAGEGAAGRLWEAQNRLAGLCTEHDLSRSCRLRMIRDIAASLYDHAALLNEDRITAEMQMGLLGKVKDAFKALEPFGENEMNAVRAAEEMLGLAEGELRLLSE